MRSLVASERDRRPDLYCQPDPVEETVDERMAARNATSKGAPGEWGDRATLLAAATALRLHIRICSIPEPQIDIFPAQGDAVDLRTITLTHHREEKHYNSTRPLGGGACAAPP